MRRADRSRIPAAALVVALLASTWGLSVAQKPNILLILVDDLGYNDLSMTGSPDIKTPHIDKLCRDGVTFTDAHSVAGFCSPARAALLSGRNPWHFGHIYNPPHDLKDLNAGMPLHITTVAETLKAAGYATMVAGKWHVGTTEMHHPMKRGFDRFFGFLNGRHTYTSNVMPGLTGRPYYVYDDYKIADKVTYLTDDLAEKSMDFMRQSKKAGKPFFIFHSVNAPHGPLEFKPEDADESIQDADRRAYAAMIKALDDTVKRMRDRIDDLGLKRETLIIFTNDNGGKQKVSDNYPLRDYKGSSYEGGVRIPFCMTWPRTIRSQTENAQLISLIDVYPTLQAIAKVAEQDKNPDLQGVNLMPYIIRSKKQTPPSSGRVRRYQFGLKGVHRATIRDGPWKLHLRRDRRKQPWTLKTKQTALYNLDDDIAESNNLLDDKGNRELAQTMLDRFLPWSAKVMDPLFLDGKFFVATNPLKVSIPRHPTSVKVGEDNRFVAKGSSTKGKQVFYSWEVFRKDDEIFYTFNDVKKTKGVVISDRYHRKPFIKFQEPGKWIVRANIEDRDRWVQWTDLEVNVDK